MPGNNKAQGPNALKGLDPVSLILHQIRELSRGQREQIEDALRGVNKNPNKYIEMKQENYYEKKIDELLNLQALIQENEKRTGKNANEENVEGDMVEMKEKLDNLLKEMEEDPILLWNYCLKNFKSIGKRIVIGGKPAFVVERQDGMKCMMWGSKQCSEWFEEVWYPVEIGGKPAFVVERQDGMKCMMWGTEQCSEWYNNVWQPAREIDGKLVFQVSHDYRSGIVMGNKLNVDWKIPGIPYNVGGKLVVKKWGSPDCSSIVWGGEEDYYDSIGEIVDIDGLPVFNAEMQSICIKRKPDFKKKNSGNRCIMQGNKQYSEWFKYVGAPVNIGGKPAYKVQREDGMECVMLGTEQCSEWFEKVGDPVEIGGKPVFKANKEGEWCMMQGNEQCGDWYEGIGDPINVGGKPLFEVKKWGKWSVMLGNEQYSDWYEKIFDKVVLNGKLILRVKEKGKKVMKVLNLPTIKDEVDN